MTINSARFQAGSPAFAKPAPASEEIGLKLEQIGLWIMQQTRSSKNLDAFQSDYLYLKAWPLLHIMLFTYSQMPALKET